MSNEIQKPGNAQCYLLLKYVMQTYIFHLWLKIYMTLGGLKLILLWDPKVAHCCQLQKQKPS